MLLLFFRKDETWRRGVQPVAWVLAQGVQADSARRGSHRPLISSHRISLHPTTTYHLSSSWISNPHKILTQITSILYIQRLPNITINYTPLEEHTTLRPPRQVSVSHSQIEHWSPLYMRQ